jgi:RNA polymerase sigma-70 factor (ECF subfamily)
MTLHSPLRMEDSARSIELVQGSSTEAFCELVQKYQARVRTFLGRYVQNKAIVDDLAQETFLSAYQSLATYDHRKSMSPWLLGIARNRALMYFRDEHNRRARETRASISTLANWWASQIEMDDFAQETHENELAALETCVKGLPRNSSSLIREYYFRGRTAAEIAFEGGKTENAIWVTMLRLREALRRCVETRLADMGA